MCELTGFFKPIRFFVAEKLIALNNRFISFSADGIGDFAKLNSIANTITELSSRFKGNAMYYTGVVNGICIVMGSNINLIYCAPLLPGSFLSYGVCLFGSDLADSKALITVISDILAPPTKAAPNGNHFVKGGMALLRSG